MNKDELVQGIIESLAKCQRPALNAGWQKLGLSHAEAGVLYLLAYRQPVSVKQTADYLGVSKSAISQLIEPLVDKQLINRRPDPHDRRIARLSLSTQGTNLLRRLAKHKFAGLRSALEGLSQAELGTLYNLHHKMALEVGKQEIKSD